MERLTGYNSFGGVYGIGMRCGDNTDTIHAIIERLAYYEDLEEQGRLLVLTVEDVHPCRNCDVGWGSISSEGCHTCDETCERLKKYNEKYNK